MISATTLLAWSALSVGLAVTPGADTALVATNAARAGVGAGLRTIAGIVTGGAFYTALFGFGLLRIIAATPVLFMVVKTAGAIYLAFLGVQLIRSALKPKTETQAAVASANAAHPWRQGFLCNALNPKVALFFLAALPQFVQAGPDAPLIGAVLIAVSYAIGAAWLSGIALAASRVGHMFRASAFARWIEGAVGAAFLALAGRLAVERA
ncbi:LysE family translocator [Terricaulis sp.]|uniref:LysE family translocator n=1 Tax=Terricaulis sp. TaxID=2768686 RepID=UPI0037840EB8